jgi:hypothetical protein
MEALISEPVCAHLVHTVHTMCTLCTPCAHCAHCLRASRRHFRHVASVSLPYHYSEQAVCIVRIWKNVLDSAWFLRCDTKHQESTVCTECAQCVHWVCTVCSECAQCALSVHSRHELSSVCTISAKLQNMYQVCPKWCWFWYNWFFVHTWAKSRQRHLHQSTTPGVQLQCCLQSCAFGSHRSSERREAACCCPSWTNGAMKRKETSEKSHSAHSVCSVVSDTWVCTECSWQNVHTALKKGIKSAQSAKECTKTQCAHETIVLKQSPVYP